MDTKEFQIIAYWGFCADYMDGLEYSTTDKNVCICKDIAGEHHIFIDCAESFDYEGNQNIVAFSYLGKTGKPIENIAEFIDCFSKEYVLQNEMLYYDICERQDVYADELDLSVCLDIECSIKKSFVNLLQWDEIPWQAFDYYEDGEDYFPIRIWSKTYTVNPSIEFVYMG